MLRAGIDLGGTKIEGILLDETHHVQFRRRIPTEQEGGYTHILERIVLLENMICTAAAGRPYTLGIGTPGSLSPRSGLLRNSNTLCLNGKPLAADLSAHLERSVPVHNDADCFALAEALMGVARGRECVFGVIMGTGCGGGIVMNGRVRKGPHAVCGEWGHSSIDIQGRPCWCGARGCVETYLSGGALERAWRAQTGKAHAMPDIVADARRGEAHARTFIGQFLQHFGRALANVVNILDPDIIVLGGGLSAIDELYTEGAAQMRRFVFSDFCETPVVRNELGDSAGVFGAALVGE